MMWGSSQSQSDCNLARSARRSSKQQATHIRACNQQYQPAGNKQKHEEQCEFNWDAVVAHLFNARKRIEPDLIGNERFAWITLSPLMDCDTDGGLRLRPLHSISQAC